VVVGLERAGGVAREDLLRIYSQDTLDDSDVQRVMAILEEVGAPEYSEQLTHESAQRAVAALENVELPSWARAEVGELVDFLARRQF
jgi:geranylgeranyl pyrophosphate synthase